MAGDHRVNETGHAILLTGASGYLGSRLLSALLARGERVVCLQHRRPLSLQHPGLVVVQMGLDDASRLEAVLVGQGVNRVLHLAGVSRASPKRLHAVNVQGTENLLMAATRAGVRHFLYVSSRDAVHPVRTRYGDSKRLAEQRVRESGLPWTILRPNLVYGEAGGAVQVLCDFARRWRVYPRPGSGRQCWHPVLLDQVVQTLCHCSVEAPRQQTIELHGEAVAQSRFLAERLAEAGVHAWPVPLPESVLGLLRWLVWPLPGWRETVDKLRLNAGDR